MTTDVDRLAAFKAWRADQQAPASKLISAFGSDWEFPAEMPAPLWLYIQERKAEGRGRDDMSDADMWELIHVGVPSDVLDEWRQLPVSVQDMATAVLSAVNSYYRRSADPEAPTPATGTGSAPTTNASPSTSSPTGEQSRLTSTGNTASTSERERSTDAAGDGSS